MKTLWVDEVPTWERKGEGGQGGRHREIRVVEDEYQQMNMGACHEKGHWNEEANVAKIVKETFKVYEETGFSKKVVNSGKEEEGDM